MKPWVKYTIIRVGLFVVLFAITYPLFLASGVMSLQISGVAAAIVSAIASLCISYLGFSTLRNEMAVDLAQRRAQPPVNPDEEAEDALEGDRPGETKPEQ
ncbi:hypothetical protein BH11ACT2_BH11ACT2_21310 [soil metagenome]